MKKAIAIAILTIFSLIPVYVIGSTKTDKASEEMMVSFYNDYLKDLKKYRNLPIAVSASAKKAINAREVVLHRTEISKITDKMMIALIDLTKTAFSMVKDEDTDRRWRISIWLMKSYKDLLASGIEAENLVIHSNIILDKSLYQEHLLSIVKKKAASLSKTVKINLSQNEIYNIVEKYL